MAGWQRTSKEGLRNVDEAWATRDRPVEDRLRGLLYPQATQGERVPIRRIGQMATFHSQPSPHLKKCWHPKGRGKVVQALVDTSTKEVHHTATASKNEFSESGIKEGECRSCLILGNGRDPIAKWAQMKLRENLSVLRQEIPQEMGAKVTP